MRWHSMHVHYHDDLDAPILGAVRPLFHTLTGQVAAAYFVRHWRRGPHLRLNFRTDDETFCGTVQPAADRIVGSWLVDQPSTATPDPQALLPSHERLAELEQESGPLLPWCPNNSVHVADYDGREHVLGSEAAVELLAGFFVDTTDLAFHTLERVRAGANRLRIAFDLMIATAHALSGADITVGFISFRSHADGFLHFWPEGRGQRDSWEARYRRHAADLAARVKTLTTAIDQGVAVPFVSEWLDVVRAYRSTGRDLIESGAIRMPFPFTDDDLASPLMEQASDFHRALFTNDYFMGTFRGSVWFATYRLMINYLYLHLTRVGITPGQRFLLCHLAASAVEEAFGLSAVEIAARTGPARSGT